MNKVLKAIREASISVACLLDDAKTAQVYCMEVKDLHHIQNQITIIENYLDPFTVAELDEMKDDGLLGYGNDVLYRLGISTDLKPYYDSIKGDGAWDKLPEDVRYDIARSSERGLEGFMGDYTEAFDEAIAWREATDG